MTEAILAGLRAAGAATSYDPAAASAADPAAASTAPAAVPATTDPYISSSSAAAAAPAAAPAAASAAVPGPSKITATNPFTPPAASDAASAGDPEGDGFLAGVVARPTVGHHEPGAHKPATNDGPQAANKAAVKAAGMTKKSVDLKTKRDAAIAAAAKAGADGPLSSLAQNLINKGSAPAGPQTRIDENARGQANEASRLRQQGDYRTSSAAASSSAPAGEDRGRGKEKGKEPARDRSKSPRGIRDSDL